MPKVRYKVQNWRRYNQALKDRYRLDVWMSDEVMKCWKAEPTGRRGAQPEYSDLAIQFCLTMRELFRLPLRGTEGFVGSIMRLLALALPVPNFSTFSRRGKCLKVKLPRLRASDNVHLALDTSGLKVYGEGEWKVKMHGLSKRRTWRKLHIGLDGETGEILAAVLSTPEVADAEAFPKVLSQVSGTIKTVVGDGAYDKRNVYKAIEVRNSWAVIPSRRGARIWQHGNSKAPPLQRDENLRYIRRYGRTRWKIASGYHRRSLVENAFFRLKRIFGERLYSRSLESQATEAFIRLAALNRMSALGMPQSCPVLN